MKRLKKLLSLLLAIVTVLTFSVSPTNAVTGSADFDIGNSYATTAYENTFQWLNDSLEGCKYSGSSGTYWFGDSPFNADRITHTDIITVDAVGSISIGISDVSASIEGDTISIPYTVYDTWYLTVHYDYIVNGVILYADFNTSTIIQFGSTFYTWSN